MLNCWIGVGRLTKDPVYRVAQSSGKGCCSFTIADERDIKKEGYPTADFINCVAWNKFAEVIRDYTKKGSMVGIKGRIQNRNYDGQDGKKVYVTEILVESVQLISTEKSAVHQETQDGEPTSTGGVVIDSDDLPFN